jgi:serine phosphatase RsbU (regulator of sigma subunit)
MDSVFRALQGRLRHPVALGAAAVACAAGAASAAAQLPSVPEPRSAPEQVGKTIQQVPEQVDRTLQQPLPEPAESLVEDTPAGEVRETVRETVRDATGAGDGGGGGGGGSGGGAASSGSAPAAPTGDQSAATPQGGSDPAPGSGGDGGGGGGGAEPSDAGEPSDASEPTGAAGGAGGGAADSEPSDGRRERAAGEEDRDGPVGRAFQGIVAVIPGWLWAVIAVLAVAVLALAARTGVERRRRRRLERERVQLLGDLGLLQSALLPDVPDRLGALAASVAYRPAAGPAAGGDFYDAFELPDGKVAAILGDVSGHGREALVRTASVRHSLRTFLRSGLEPRAALAAAGNLMTDAEEGEFVTVVAAVHDPLAGTFTYAGAGHPPPIVRGPGAHTPVTVASSPPLGLGLPTGLRQTTVALPWGGVACLYTDGLLEARVDGELVGWDRLSQMVADLGPGEGAERLLARILEDADETPDDMAACVLRAVDGPHDEHPRVEVLEIGPAAVDLEVAGDLLTTCGVSEGAAAEAVEVAAGVVADSGAAVIAVTVGPGRPRVEVTGPAESALPAAGDRPTVAGDQPTVPGDG